MKQKRLLKRLRSKVFLRTLMLPAALVMIMLIVGLLMPVQQTLSCRVAEQRCHYTERFLWRTDSESIPWTNIERFRWRRSYGRGHTHWLECVTRKGQVFQVRQPSLEVAQALAMRFYDYVSSPRNTVTQKALTTETADQTVWAVIILVLHGGLFLFLIWPQNGPCCTAAPTSQPLSGALALHINRKKTGKLSKSVYRRIFSLAGSWTMGEKGNREEQCGRCGKNGPGSSEWVSFC